MQIGNYSALLLLLVIPLMLYLKKQYSKSASVKVASLHNYKRLKPTLKQRLRVIPLILRILAVLLLVFAIARPRIGRDKIIDRSNGIAIEMVLDRSGSMQAPMDYRGRESNRLDVAKEVFVEFILGDSELEGRSNDLVGIVSYAKYSDTICPLTLDHKTLPEFLKQIHLPLSRNEDGTAIGDAIELAAARLYTAEKELKKRKLIGGDYDGIKSKVIILMTDGNDNSSRTSLEQAVKICQEWGIKVYTIGIGDTQGGFFSSRSNGVDIRSLKYISQKTGGQFFLADSDKTMVQVYKEIDNLEKSEVESVKYTEYSERFMELAISALALLLLEVLLRATIFRVIP